MIKIPNYTIEKELDQGGTAVVYLAVQDMLNRRVALKVMRPNIAQDTNYKASFLSEGSIIAHLEHPNIVRIYDIGVVDDSTFFMAMEYLGGGTLKKQLRQNKLAYSKSVKILEEVSKGLVYAHIKGYIHRDIKPGNILFRNDGTAVLTDFGIAKRQDSSGELTQLGFTKGTVQYMSPEQVVTTDLDQRSDIYSLGLVFYEMLTGLKAFLAESTIQAIHQHTTVPPPTLPKEYAFLQGIFDKVLAKAPEDRFQSVDAFVYAVKAANSSDETVVHRIGRTTNQNDNTHIYEPSESTTTKKKSRFGLAVGLVGSLFLVALLGYGAVNYLGIVESETNIEPLKETPLTKDILQPNQKNETVTPTLSQANSLAVKAGSTALTTEQKRLDDAREASRLAALTAEQKRQDDAREASKLAASAAEQKRQDDAREASRLAALAAEQKRQDDAREASRLAALTATRALTLKPGIVRVRASLNRKTVSALLTVTRSGESISIRDNRSPATLRLPAGKYEINAKYGNKVLNKTVTVNADGDITERFKFVGDIANNSQQPARPAQQPSNRQPPVRPSQQQLSNSQQPVRSLPLASRGSGRINLSTSLNGKAFPTSYIITQDGKRVRTVTGKSSASFSLPLGKYTVSAYYKGKPYPQHFELEEGDIINLPIRFSTNRGKK